MALVESKSLLRSLIEEVAVLVTVETCKYRLAVR